ncbi:DUF1183-domain-containing protein, partial [Exidia glandulosa HHB12029]
MPTHTKVKLSDIESLTFYAGEKTAARRTSPIDQLKCIGKPCRTYKPDVVRCINTGGIGVEVDWKCEADLPSTLRLGRVEVSCEGWSRAGDPDVLKGSCGLEYHLQEIPKAYRDHYNTEKSTSGSTLDSVIDWAFYSLFIAVFLFIFYRIVISCLTRPDRPVNAGGSRGGPGGGGGGWFNTGGGGGRPDYGPNGPPPPYKEQPSDSSSFGATGWRPGFWTGLGMGGLFGRYFRPSPYVPPYEQQAPRWEWERPYTWYAPRPSRTYRAPPPQESERASSGWFNTGRSSSYQDTDGGEGSSSGAARRSTGYGGSR